MAEAAPELPRVGQREYPGDVRATSQPGEPRLSAGAERPLVVGVDGGGTALRALTTDASGVELARYEVPGASVTVGSLAQAAKAVRSAVIGACARAGGELPVDALWAGLAGAGTEPVRAALERALATDRGHGLDAAGHGGAGLARRAAVGTDVEAAFRDAFPSGAGILLLAGTGSIAWGRGEDGREGRAGGWGWRLGDEGSGYALALSALRRVARSADGRAPPTELTRLLLARRRFARPEELIAWASAAGATEIAALAPDVHAAAARGDLAAKEILKRAASALLLHVVALVERLGPWRTPPTVAFGGGLLGVGRGLRDRIARAVRARGLTPLELDLDPVRGAASLALDLARAPCGEHGTS